jgi:hypothetical protein
MATQETTKIFRIEVPGAEAAVGKLQQLNQEFELLKAIKKEANKVLAANPADAEVIERQTKLLAENEIALKKVTAEKKIASKEADVLIAASRKLAESQLNEANASKYAAGSYNQLYASYKALLDQYRNTPTTSPFFEQVKASAVAAKQKVDEFNRSLSPDGTLVGEYKTGILNAFRSLGLESIIKDQKTKIESAIRDLSAQNEQLARQYKESGKEGKEAFASIQAQIAKNVETQGKLGENLKQINASLKNTGTIGSQVTHALGEGFSEILKTGLAVVGVSIGLHEAFNFIRDSLKEFAASELKVQQLHATLDNLGRADAIPLITHQVDQLKAKFDFLNKSDIFDVFRKLIDYGKLTAKQMSDLVPLIINLASKQRIPIQQASDTIVRALEGNQKGLQEFGIHLSKTASETERLASVMTSLKEKTQGAAEVFGKSAAGELESGRQKLVDLREEIGNRLMPLMLKLTDFSAKALRGLKPFFEDLKSFFTLGSNGTIAEHEAERRFQAEQAFNQKARDQATQKQVNDRVNQYEEAIKKGIISRADAIKNLRDRLSNGKDDQFNQDVVSGIISGLDTRKLGVPSVNEDLAKKLRLKRIAEIEAEAVQEQIILEKKREAGKVSERQYQNELYSILKTAEERKMAVLTKGSTEELKQASQIQLQLLKDRRAFLDKMFTLDKESVEARRTTDLQAAQTTLDQVLNNPLSTELQKSNAQLVFDSKRLQIEKTFTASMDQLEKQYAKKSEKNAADRAKAISDIEQKNFKDLLDNSLVSLNDIDVQTAKRIAGIRLQFDSLRQGIVDGKGSRFQKTSRLTTLGETENISILSQQLEGDTQKAEEARKAFDLGRITFEQYAAAVDKATQSQLKLKDALEKNKTNITSVKELLQNSIGNSLRFDSNTDLGREQRKLLGDTIADTFNTAGLAMNNYFDMEKNRIDASNRITQEKLSLELSQQKARAQSQAERDALDRQYQAKKNAADKDAFEKSKKIQIAQAEINLGIQLSNLAVIAFAPNPLNIATLGTAGAIMYAIQAALALVNFALNVNKIKSAQFERGGSLNEVLGQGGEFGGSSHAQGGNKFLFQNMPVETEAKEAYVINKNATQHQGTFTVTGTPRQIASAINTIGGGRPFDSGAMVYRRFDYGGYLGSSLHAPVNPSSFLSSGSSNLEELTSMVAQTHASLVQTNQRIDNIKVHVVTREVEAALNKKVKNDSINSL